jgi:ABC-type multidrug transport system fused ATPase/permease subunit
LPTSTPRPADPLRDIPHYLRLFRSYIGRRMYLVFALAVLAALAEGLGILMLLPLFEALDAGFSGTENTKVGKALQGTLVALGLDGSVLALLLLIAGFFVLKFLFLFGSGAYKAALQAQLQRELKARLLRDYNRMRLQYYVSRDTGHFLNVIGGQLGGFIACFNGLMLLGAQVVTTVMYLGLAIVVAWRFGLMALGIGLALLLLFKQLNVWVRAVSRTVSLENGVLSKLLVQSLQSLKYLMATGKTAHLEKETLASVHRLTGHEIKLGIANAFTGNVREPIAVLAVMAVVAVQLLWLQQPLGPILVSIILFYRGLNAVLGLQGTWQSALNQVGAVELVRDEFARLALEAEVDGERVLTPLVHGITLRDVHFAYTPDAPPVLNGVNLHIPCRRSVALVGESGAGKSTLVDLLTLLLQPDRGEVLIDGVPGHCIQRASWRRQIGFVSQETVVFDDTIANNIGLWQGDPRSDEVLLTRIKEAARQAHIAHFIEGLPDGYHTLVGDRGVRLSGGQRQRLFIARELFKRPSLLILDEATSALDSESERAIQRSIDALKGQITVVIIAHRLATIRNVDTVYVLDHGRVVEAGDYAELRDDDASRFSRMVAMQQL